jgi:two-component system, NarL family, sensor histidine kinase UhpB
MGRALNSLRFRLLAFPIALLMFWLVLALLGAIYDARGRIAAEVKASSALARALISAASSGGRDSASTLIEVEKHLPPTRHVLLGIASSSDPAAIKDTAAALSMQEAAPAWFVRLIAPKQYAELVRVPPGGQAGSAGEWIYIIANPADEIGEVWQDFCYFAEICSALVIVIAGSSLWLASTALRPIRTLGDGLERLERHDFQSLESVRFTELERIGAQFDSLAFSLKEKTEENRQLYAKLVSAQENERRHVARELHDELGPCLFAIRAETASILQSLPQSEAGGFIAERAKAIEALTGTVQQINRRVLHTLQPAVLSERGLAAALRDLADGWQEAYPAIAWSLDIQESNLACLSDEAALAIYRMVQEGLTNIARHSACSEAEIVISKRKAGAVEKLDVLVKDDGRGFDAPPAPGGGLQGMQERIRKLGGDFSIWGENGSGVAVRASIPLTASMTP